MKQDLSGSISDDQKTLIHLLPVHPYFPQKKAPRPKSWGFSPNNQQPLAINRRYCARHISQAQQTQAVLQDKEHFAVGDGSACAAAGNGLVNIIDHRHDVIGCRFPGRFFGCGQPGRPE